jgi:hypothetical protein
METLVALTEGLEVGGESIHTSVFLEQTIDASQLSQQGDSCGAVVSPGVPPTSSGDESDLEGLPLRHMIEPGGDAAPHADYRLVGAIGRGGTGIVYQAHQRAVNREVAIKVLRNHLRGDRAARQRFLAEARTVGALDHPNVLALHELALDGEGHPFYSMKRIDGTAWSAVIAEQSLEENLRILLGVADALRYAHSRGIVHRDIKPANVMLGRYGEVLVADWGLALPHPLGETAETERPSIGGTPAYMAPELASGVLTQIGPRTDVYLLGATLFQLLTGYPPHEGDSLVDCIYNAALNRIRSTELQSELMDIAMVAMATDPDERYASVDDFQQAIRNYQQHQESIALMRRAIRLSGSDEGPATYEQLSLATSLAREALELWPENRRAAGTLRRLQRQFAELALEQDDLDLALSLLEAAGEEAGELAQRIQRRREQRSAQIRREHRYSTLFASSPDAVLVTRLRDGMILDANDSFERTFKFTRDEVVGSRVAEIDLWECPARRVDFISQIRDTGRVDNFETILKTKQGKPVPALISARQAEVDGETLVVGHTRDITRRREAEVKLRRSRERLREVQRLAQLGTWEYNLETGEIHWSDETFRISGLNPDDRPPSFEEYLNIIHPQDRGKLERALENAVQNGAAYHLQIRHRRPDGSYNTTIARGQPMLDDTGKVVALFGSVLDVTDRKQREERLKEQSRSLQALLDLVDRPLLALQRNGRLVAAAGPVLRLLGRKSCCLQREIFFELREQPDWKALELSAGSHIEGQFVEDGSPLGPVLRLRVEPQDDLLRCELA